MQTNEQIRSKILELCSESEYGSWEFWSDRNNKTEEECEQLFQALIDLVNEKLIISTEHKHIVDRSYTEAPLDTIRLKNELKRSMKPYNVDPDSFYWFFATDDGKRNDLLNRRRKQYD